MKYFRQSNEVSEVDRSTIHHIRFISCDLLFVADTHSKLTRSVTADTSEDLQLVAYASEDLQLVVYASEDLQLVSYSSEDLQLVSYTSEDLQWT